MTDALHFLSLAELGKQIRAKQLSPVELVQSLLARIKRYDPKIQSFIRVTEDVALAQARAAELEIAAGLYRGPLHGIPVGLKDIIATAGIPSTAHSKLLQDHVPAEDAVVTQRLHAAGAVLMGKLATFEFALGGPSWDLPWPPALNPWNTAYLPGGSSSGSGAALAAGFVAGALGTDTGGSVRWPAAVCGIVGLKPTYGRISRRGVLPNTFTMDHCGPMSRTVEDCAILLQVLAGFDAADPGSADVPVPDYRAALTGDISGLRIGLVRHWYAEGAHPDIAPAVDRAARKLAELGAIVEEVRLSSLLDYADCKTTLSAAELYAIHEPDLKRRPQDFGAKLRNRVLPGGLIRAEDYVQAQRRRLALCREFEGAFKRFDLLVTATWLTTADPADPNLDDKLTQVPQPTSPSSVTGTPAIAVPCGVSREGLPLSLQITGRPFAEPLVLRAAHAFERATEWHCRHPDLDQTTQGKAADHAFRPAAAPGAAPGRPASTPDEIRAQLKLAGLTLSEPQIAELLAIYPSYEAMVRRLPRGYGYTDEPAHSFAPARLIGRG
ncbi:MAG: amidase [Proteobacteria bacterium]|nr:amidase [Pseudomonadota bacterium]